ncbi:MAG: molybdopterin-binding protein [Proteobacteria bacterium]|nr:molybdopterin-binding protein [Pseudomonadota bacterium]
MQGPSHLSQRIGRLTALADVMGMIDRLVAPVPPRSLAPAAAAGTTLAADVAVVAAHPSVALALRDGWAVCAQDTLDAGSYAPALLPRAPRRVDCGQPLPADTDAVLPFDALETNAAGAQALAPVAPGEGVLPIAADAVPGAALRRAGQRLRATDVAVLRALDVARVSVRAARLRILAARAGDPVIAAAGGWLALASTQYGAIASGYEPEVVAPHDLHKALIAPDADAVFVVGGSGAGGNDIAVATLARIGQLVVHGVGIIPGETAAFGVAAQRPVLIYPGRIDAVFAVFVTLGQFLLARLAARADEEAPVTVMLSRKIASSIGFTEIVPVRRNGEQAEPLASAYLSLSSLAQADGYVTVPAASEGHAVGARVAVRPLP